MNDFKKIELLEKLHQNNLTEEDHLLIEELKQNDQDFEKEIKAYSDLLDAFDALHVDNFKENLNAFENKYSSKAKTTGKNKEAKTAAIRPLYRVISAAAAILVLLGSAILYNQYIHGPFNQHFAANESIAIHLTSTRGNQELSKEEKLKKSAFNKFIQKDYKACLDELYLYESGSKGLFEKDQQSLLIAGVSHLSLDDAKQAISYLNKAVALQTEQILVDLDLEDHIESSETEDSTDKSITDEAMINKDSTASKTLLVSRLYTASSEWYLALAYLRDRQMDSAKEMLQEILSDEEHSYYSQAEELIQQI
jgi:hypothetical protein